MPFHTRRGAFGTTVWVCVGFVLDPRYAVCFVLADAVRRMDLSLEDSIKLGGVLFAMGVVGGMSCGGTGCLSCRGKQSTSSSLLLSSSSWIGFGPNPRYADCFVLVGGL